MIVTVSTVAVCIQEGVVSGLLIDTGVPHTTVVVTVSLKSLKYTMISLLSVALDLHTFSFIG